MWIRTVSLPFNYNRTCNNFSTGLQAEEGSGRILIARVMHGGAADRSGLIAVGDEVIEVRERSFSSA